MLGPYRYHCPSCELTSDPYFLRSKADDVGDDHRDRRHDGMHPTGECILTSGEWRAPQGGERTAVVVFAVVMLFAIVSQWL
ncbi:hypothetical protein [Streptomyces salinarius]|uniref:hypothetical protein n=1 Tax=Streptomyces salinarius TaxID=2762598 RepID=UPI0028528CB5|nr:hypothetical protein [Streptomyces salinarius]